MVLNCRDEPKDMEESSASGVVVSAIVPAHRLDSRELLRVGAGLGNALGGAYGKAVVAAARVEGAVPMPVEMVLMRRDDRGVLASSERRLLALGTRSFLLGLGIVPQRVDPRTVASIEAAGGQVMYIVVVDRPRYLGLFGFQPGRE